MKKGRLITIIILVFITFVTAFVLMKTDIISKVFKLKADTNQIVLQDNEAMFKTGVEFNVKMKTLAGDEEATNIEQNKNITKIQKSNTLSITPTEDNIVSIDKGKPIYMWFNNGIIYYYTVASRIYLNEDSSYMFSSLHNLTTLDLSNFDTRYVTIMESIFRDCKSLTSIDISSFDTSKVSNMEYMFAENDALSNINLGNINTSNVTNMKWMFYNCKNLQSIDLSKLNTTKLKDMAAMFSNCIALTRVDLSNFDTSNVTGMNQMFSGCESLTEIIFGNNFDTSKVTNMASMFFNCKKLASIDVSTFDTRNVEYMSNMFDKCELLVNLNLSNFNTKKVIYMPGMFGGCKALTNITFGKDFDTKNVINIRAMFSGCSSLTSLNLSSFNTEKVEDMAYMFYNCSSLETLDLSNFNTKNVVTMSHLFSDCESLYSLNISNFDTSKVTDMGFMFNYCKSLEILDLSSFDTSNVQSMLSTFNHCTNLTTIYVNNKFVVPESAVAAFYESEKLVGMNGTQCDYENYNNPELFKIDLGKISPGFFSVNLANLKLISDDYYIDNNNYIIIENPIELSKITPSISFNVVKADDKINIVYNTLTLKSYDIIDLSSLDIRDDNIVFAKTKTVGELKTSLGIDSIIIKDSKGNVKSDTSKLGTGDKLIIGDKTYNISVKGDLSGDGETMFEDVSISYTCFKTSSSCSDTLKIAADVSNNNAVGFDDISIIYGLFKNRN